MFPPLSEEQFNEIVKILKKPEALRDVKLEIVPILNEIILKKWT
jgi:hypothetical protein